MKKGKNVQEEMKRATSSDNLPNRELWPVVYLRGNQGDKAGKGGVPLIKGYGMALLKVQMGRQLMIVASLCTRILVNLSLHSR